MPQYAFDSTTGASSYPWLDCAWSELGVAVSESPDMAARIHTYFTDAGHPEVTGNTTAWCAAFVGACLVRSGLSCTRSLLARSYLSYGLSVTKAATGAIAVFSRGSDPSIGHVGFVVGETANCLIILGGNQSHAVSIVEMPRSALLGLRWPVATVQSPIAPSDGAPVSAPAVVVSNGTDTVADAAFESAVVHVLQIEGGYTDDPYDPGGPTNLGITMADIATVRAIPNTSENAQTLRSAVVALTPADARLAYKALYWKPSSAPLLPPALGFFHFDTAVNHGLASAARMLQQALGVDADGEIGPQTLAAAMAVDASRALAAYADIRRARYRSLPTFWRFGRGWLARVDATLSAASDLERQRPSPPADPPQEKNMPTTTIPAAPAPQSPSSPYDSAGTIPGTKWWGSSMTIWGSLITTLSTVLPVVGPFIGIEVSADVVHQLGDSVVHAAQAIGGVVGILMTIYGRTRATQSLMRRDFALRL